MGNPDYSHNNLQNTLLTLFTASEQRPNYIPSGIPYTLPEGNEDKDVPTFWLLLRQLGTLGLVSVSSQPFAHLAQVLCTWRDQH